MCVMATVESVYEVSGKKIGTNKKATEKQTRTIMQYLLPMKIIHTYLVPHGTHVILQLCSYLIWPCDIDVHITYFISHSFSLSYNAVIKGYFKLGV